MLRRRDRRNLRKLQARLDKQVLDPQVREHLSRVRLLFIVGGRRDNMVAGWPNRR